MTYWQTIYIQLAYGTRAIPNSGRNKLSEFQRATRLFRKQFTRHLRSSATTRSYRQSDHFSPNSGQTGLVSFNELLKCCRKLSFQHNGRLYCRACCRSEAYTALFSGKGKLFFRWHNADVPTESTSCCDTLAVETLPNPNTRRERLAARVLGDNIPPKNKAISGLNYSNFLRKSHTLMDQSTDRERKTEVYEVLQKQYRSTVYRPNSTPIISIPHCNIWCWKVGRRCSRKRRIRSARDRARHQALRGVPCHQTPHSITLPGICSSHCSESLEPSLMARPF